MAKKKWHNQVIMLNHPVEGVPIPIVHDSAVANRDICGGRLVPLLILDLSGRADVKACFEAHKEFRAGEVKTMWGRRDSPDSGPVTLTIMFERPAVCTVILHFDVEKYGGLVDQIVATEAVWLTSGTVGDRFLDTQDRVKIFAGVPSTDFRAAWDDILDRSLRDQVQRRGATGREAKLYSRRVREDWRKISGGFRAARRS